MKMFNGGGQQQAQGGQNKFIGLAMSQAAQLFDKQQSQGKTVGTNTIFDRLRLTHSRILVPPSRTLSPRLLRWLSSST